MTASDVERARRSANDINVDASGSQDIHSRVKQHAEKRRPIFRLHVSESTRRPRRLGARIAALLIDNVYRVEL